ncbi:hypothetical protein [Roseospira navarrensis]|uniref:Uncharacterized protein n=1 Tax=Roseospira navarrensis TaxID=140058 RepID=A0A7X1ZBT7_9PROT|nr:hypothetical protein [Roseospira navarrensis]MQX35653.1 hypothetical protein [Roseospira navarrensis]
MYSAPDVKAAYRRSIPLGLVESRTMPSSRTLRNTLLAGLRQNGFSNVELYRSVDMFLDHEHSAKAKTECIFLQYSADTPALLEIVADIRKNKTCLSPFIYIFVIAEHIGYSDIVHIIKSGVDDIILLPLEFGTLAHRFSSIVPRPKKYLLSYDYIGPEHPAVHAHFRPVATRIARHNGVLDYLRDGVTSPPNPWLTDKINSAVVLNDLGVDIMKISANMQKVSTLFFEGKNTVRNYNDMFRSIFFLRKSISSAVKATSATDLSSVSDILNASHIILSRFHPDKDLSQNTREVKVFQLISKAFEVMYLDSWARENSTQDIVSLIEQHFLKTNIFESTGQWRQSTAKVSVQSAPARAAAAAGAVQTPAPHAPPAPTPAPAPAPMPTSTSTPETTPPAAPSPTKPESRESRHPIEYASLREAFADLRDARTVPDRFIAFLAGMARVQFTPYRSNAAVASNDCYAQPSFVSELATLIEEIVGPDMLSSRYVRSWAQATLATGFRPMEEITNLQTDQGMRQAWTLSLQKCLEAGDLRDRVEARRDRLPGLVESLTPHVIRDLTEIMFSDPRAVPDAEAAINRARSELIQTRHGYWGVLRAISRSRGRLPECCDGYMILKIAHAVFSRPQANVVAQCMAHGGETCSLMHCTEQLMMPRHCERALNRQPMRKSAAAFPQAAD